jgi:hypothetical protein
MSRAKFLVLPLIAGMLNGCTTLVRGVDWIHGVMTKQEPDEDINNYGAFFTAPLSGGCQCQRVSSRACVLPPKPGQ